MAAMVTRSDVNTTSVLPVLAACRCVCVCGSAVVMSNLLLRFSSSFACVPVELALGRTRKTVLAHIVREVCFERVRIGFSLKYKQ